MKNKKLILILIGLVIVFLLVIGGVYITKLVIKDIQLQRAERTIEKAKQEYAYCVEVVMPQAHEKAEEARVKKSEILGTDFIIEPEQAQTKLPTVTLSGQQ